MSGFDLRWEWLDAPDADSAFGPERDTWGTITIEVDGVCVTSHRPAVGGKETSAIVGPLSGIADWIVENWVFLSWETHTPYAKTIGDRAARVPTLRDAREGALGDVEIPQLARWLHRHTLGHASSDLALPAIAFLPEDRAIGVAVMAPPYHLKPTVQFAVQWPREPAWVSRDELLGALRELVRATIDRTKASTSGRPWADWLEQRFVVAEEQSAKPDVRLKMMFGDIVASKWDRLKTSFGEDADALFGVLLDSSVVKSEAELTFLADSVKKALKQQSGTAKWRSLKAEAGEHLLPPYERGYRLARRARTLLNEPSKPLVDLNGVLSQLGVAVAPVAGPPVFRSASVADLSGHSTVVYVADHPQFGGLAPTRFTVAAGFGRLLSEAASTSSAFGAALGPQSRVRATQQANAFAAEFLLPFEALRDAGDDLTAISEDYGISRTAAQRHLENRRRS